MSFGPLTLKYNAKDTVCFLCGNRASSDSGYKGFETGGRSYEIFFCRGCGLGKTVPFLEEKKLRELYSSTVYRDNDAGKFWSPLEKIIRFLRIQRSRRVERFSHPGRILDVGCGRGDFLALMKERGWEATGLELDRRVAAYAVKSGLDLRVGNLEDVRFPDGHFDAVTLWHVFEHLREPGRVLNECRRILKPGGLLVVAVPNLESLQARLTGRHWFHLDLPYHLYHYSLKSIKRLLEISGFEVVSVRHFSLEYNPYGFIQSFFNAIGFRQNLLYDFFRSQDLSRYGYGRAYLSLAAMFIMLPVLVPLSLALSLIEAAFGRGGTVDVYARKKA